MKKEFLIENFSDFNRYCNDNYCFRDALYILKVSGIDGIIEKNPSNILDDFFFDFSCEYETFLEDEEGEHDIS